MSATAATPLDRADVVRLGGVQVELRDGTTQVVTVNHTHGVRARVSLWRLTGEGWRRQLTTDDGRTGYGGLVSGDRRVQGTGTTPLGTYGLTSTFGTHAADPRAGLPHHRIRRGDHWVQDNASRLLQPAAQPAAGRLPLVAAVVRPQLLRAADRLPAPVRVVDRHRLQRRAGAPPRLRDLPPRQRARCDRRLRERAAPVHPVARPAARPRPRPRDRDRRDERGPGRRRGPHPHDQQPRQGALPAHRHHQGRGAQLLRPGVSGAAAAPGRPGRHPDPVAARRREGELLREEHAGRDAVVGAYARGADHGLAVRQGRRHASGSRSATTSRPSRGWPTSPRSSCTSTSGPSTRTARRATPTGW